MLAPDELTRLHQILVEEQAALRQRIENLDVDGLTDDTSDSNFGVGNHPAEDALITETQEQVLSMRTEQQQRLDRIEHALQRFENGTYGTCERCGRNIGFERLAVRPEATLCIDCQREVEQ